MIFTYNSCVSEWEEALNIGEEGYGFTKMPFHVWCVPVHEDELFPSVAPMTGFCVVPDVTPFPGEEAEYEFLPEALLEDKEGPLLDDGVSLEVLFMIGEDSGVSVTSFPEVEFIPGGESNAIGVSTLTGLSPDGGKSLEVLFMVGEDIGIGIGSSLDEGFFIGGESDAMGASILTESPPIASSGSKLPPGGTPPIFGPVLASLDGCPPRLPFDWNGAVWGLSEPVK